MLLYYLERTMSDYEYDDPIEDSPDEIVQYKVEIFYCNKNNPIESFDGYTNETYMGAVTKRIKTAEYLVRNHQNHHTLVGFTIHPPELRSYIQPMLRNAGLQLHLFKSHPDHSSKLGKGTTVRNGKWVQPSNADYKLPKRRFAPDKRRYTHFYKFIISKREYYDPETGRILQSPFTHISTIVVPCKKNFEILDGKIFEITSLRNDQIFNKNYINRLPHVTKESISYLQRAVVSFINFSINNCPVTLSAEEKHLIYFPNRRPEENIYEPRCTE